MPITHVTGHAQAGRWASPSTWAVLGLALAVPASFCVDRTWSNPRRYLTLCLIRQPAAGVCPGPAHASDLGMPMQSPIGARMGIVDWACIDTNTAAQPDSR